jgi:TolA-binding protein
MARNGIGLVFTIVLSSASVAFAAPPDSVFDAAEALLAVKNGVSALAQLDRLTDLTPAQAIRAAYDRAQAKQILGQPGEAIAEILKVVPAPDATAEQRAEFVSTGGSFGKQARALLGDLYKATDQPDKVPTVYAGLTADYPKEPDWSYLLGKALLDAGRYDEAVAQLGTFIKGFPTDPKFEAASFDKAEALRRGKRYKEEYTYLLTLPIERGADWEIIAGVRRAELLSQYLKTDFAESNRISEGLVAKYPQNPEIYRAYYRLASNYLQDFPAKLRDYPRAQTLLQFLIQTFPQSPLSIVTKSDLGWSLYYQRDFLGAINQFQSLLDELKDDKLVKIWRPYVLFNISSALDQLGRIAEGDLVRAMVIAQYPDNPWANASRNLLRNVALLQSSAVVRANRVGTGPAHVLDAKRQTPVPPKR